MRFPKHFALVLFAIFAVTGSVTAQNFTSTKGGFSISLPASGAAIESISGADGQGETIKWSLKEGIIVITYLENAPGVSFKTPKDIAFFFEGVKQGIIEASAKDLVESDYKAGSFYGTAFTATLTGNPYHVRALAAIGTKYILISGLAYGNQPDADRLILKALDSFALTPSAK